MNPNLHKLFSGKFYIHESYALALAPVMLQAVAGVSFEQKSEAELISESVRTISNSYSSSESTSEKNKIVAVLSFKQPVVKYSDWNWLGTQTYIRILEQYKNDDSVAGVVLDMDCGGGQVYGTPEFYEYIVAFTAVKPLVIYTNGLLCSGAYYIAAGASWIVAHNRADAIGSIGVYTILVNFDGFYKKFGAEIHTIYSSKSPKKNKSYRDVMSGKDTDYKDYIKKELDPIAEQFAADIKAVRPQVKEEAFEGGVWSGSDSVAMGLVDENGSLDTAIAKVFELAEAGPSNDENSNNSNNSQMTKIKSFPSIQGVIGVEGDGLKVQSSSLLSGKEGVFLSEKQADDLEAAIAGHDAAITAEKGKVTTAETKQSEADGKVTKLGSAVNAAITAAGLDADVAANATTEDKITLLGSKVVEYGAKPGANVTKPKAEGDSVEEKDENAIVNKSDAHNSTYDNA